MNGARLLGFGFAAIAMAGSSIFAISMFDDNKLAQAALVAISIGCVMFEHWALVWGRESKLAGDTVARVAGTIVLIGCFAYTFTMLIGFFGNVFLKAAAQDVGIVSSLKDAELAVNELETRRTWLQKPVGSTAALEKAYSELAADKRATQQQLATARADLKDARSMDEIDDRIAKARKHVTELRATAPKDIKAAAIEGFSGGLVDGHWATYAMVVVSALLVMCLHVFLPIISGAGRRKAAVAFLPPASVPVKPVRQAKASAAVVVAQPIKPQLVSGGGDLRSKLSRLG